MEQEVLGFETLGYNTEGCEAYQERVRLL